MEYRPDSHIVKCVALRVYFVFINNKSPGSMTTSRAFLAPPVGLEPTTLRLTAACSTKRTDKPRQPVWRVFRFPAAKNTL